MPPALRNDPLGRRWWAELGQQNHAAVDDFSQCLLALLAFGPSREPSLVGSGFVIGYDDGFALALTARHVLPAGVHRSQRPALRHAGSALFVPPNWSQPSLDPNKLKAVWMCSRSTQMLNLVHLNYNDALDISAFLVVPQQGQSSFRPAAISLDTQVPAVGEVVSMVSNGGLRVTESQPPTGPDGKGQRIAIERSVSIRQGVVTGVYPQGHRQYRWPCFTTSIPAQPGMSGGFVFIPRHGETIAACGVVSADVSELEAHTNFMMCGESIVASIWPALVLTSPTMMGGGIETPPTATLYHMMRDGALGMAIGGIEHIEFIAADGGVAIRNTRVRPVGPS